VIEHWKESSEGQSMAEKRERYQNRIELLQGTLDLLICRPCSGVATWLWISVAIRNRSGELLQVEYWFALSGAAPAGKTEMDQSGMANLRKQTAGKVLPTDSFRKKSN